MGITNSVSKPPHSGFKQPPGAAGMSDHAGSRVNRGAANKQLDGCVNGVTSQMKASGPNDDAKLTDAISQCAKKYYQDAFEKPKLQPGEGL
jgi:hypothetical protein